MMFTRTSCPSTKPALQKKEEFSFINLVDGFAILQIDDRRESQVHKVYCQFII